MCDLSIPSILTLWLCNYEDSRGEFHLLLKWHQTFGEKKDSSYLPDNCYEFVKSLRHTICLPYSEVAYEPSRFWAEYRLYAESRHVRPSLRKQADPEKQRYFHPHKNIYCTIFALAGCQSLAKVIWQFHF